MSTERKIARLIPLTVEGNVIISPRLGYIIGAEEETGGPLDVLTLATQLSELFGADSLPVRDRWIEVPFTDRGSLDIPHVMVKIEHPILEELKIPLAVISGPVFDKFMSEQDGWD